MIIAKHHIPGTSEHKLSLLLGKTPEYTPKCDWPEDCMVQWGMGIIPKTPFFEAFPKGTFIRGQGETIEIAEKKAFDQFTREFSCDHLWGRQRPGGDFYRNGAGWCRKCKGFRGHMFKEIFVLGQWRKKISKWEGEWLEDLETDHEMNKHMDEKYPEDIKSRKRMQRLLRIRKNLYGVRENYLED